MKRLLKEKLKGGRFSGVSPARSRLMGSIRSRNNKSTEIQFRMLLVRSGLKSWVVHRRDIEGKPDFYFPRARVALFIDGCFWHSCGKCGHLPKTRSEFWGAKIASNRRRDKIVEQRLKSLDIKVIRVWEHELKAAVVRRQLIENLRESLRARCN